MKKAFVLFILFQSTLFGQILDKKGQLYISWGYNRSSYAPSDITFTGPGYDFKVKNALAKDKPEPFSPSVYFSITKLSIPQFNFRMGYFFTDKLSLSVGYDHMKYVFVNDQVKQIYGYIDSSASVNHAGTYTGAYQKIDIDFIGFEHTDGLNYATIDLEYFDNFYETNNQNFSLDFFGSIGIGAVVPKTNAWLFDSRGNDAFHWAGVGISGAIGARAYFFKHFYLHVGGKTGFLYMPNIATNVPENDGAKQTINFFEEFFQIGGQFSISKK